LFTEEENEEMTFHTGPEFGEFRKQELERQLMWIVWCWGWDGAGDLDGPDVDPIWEHMFERSYSEETIQVKHDRNLGGL